MQHEGPSPNLVLGQQVRIGRINSVLGLTSNTAKLSNAIFEIYRLWSHCQ